MILQDMTETILPETATLCQVAEELLRLRQRVEDLEDLRDLNAAIERNAGRPGSPWEDVCREYGWQFNEKP
jgi:hypothetical protein